MPVEVIVDVEVSGESRTRVLRLVPRTRVLTLAQERPPAPAGRMRAESDRLESKHGPRRLRGCADAHAGKRFVDVRVTRLAPAAVGILPFQQPAAGALHHVLPRSQWSECRDHAPRAVNVVHAPSPKP